VVINGSAFAQTRDSVGLGRFNPTTAFQGCGATACMVDRWQHLG
jgi:hypothetical protein